MCWEVLGDSKKGSERVQDTLFTVYGTLAKWANKYMVYTTNLQC